jgi:hypothetical protein
VAVVAGCGKPAAEPRTEKRHPADVESAPLAAHDRQMDRLGAELRQDQPQRPNFELPAGEHLVALARGESEQRMERAARLVEAGELSAALAQLYGCRFNVEDPQTYLVLRAEVEALWFEQRRAFPLAARCAAYALLHYPESVVAAEVRTRLKARRAWAWRYLGAFTVGHQLEAGAGLPQYWVQGYGNAAFSSPQDVGNAEVLHFVCFAGQTDDYLCSFVFKGRRLPGGRQVALVAHVTQGRPLVLDLCDQVPDYDQAVRQVTQLLAAGSFFGVGPGFEGP